MTAGETRCTLDRMTTPTELQRTSAALGACLVRERGLIGAATFLRELAATLDRLVAIRGH